MYKTIKLILFFIASYFISVSAQAAIYQKVPGTAVYLEVPEGFVLTGEFSGFVNDKTGATIVVATLPPANDNLKKIFNNEKKFKTMMSAQRFDITRQTYRKSRDGLLLTIYQGKQMSANGAFDKWATMVFATNAAYVVTIQAPEKAAFSNETALKIYDSLSLSNHNDETDQLSALPFTFGVQPPFVFVGSIMNQSAMLTIPSYSEDDVDRPDIVVTKGLEVTEGVPLTKVVDTYLQSIEGTVNNIEGRQISPTKFAGHPGLRLQATALMKGNPVDLVIYAAIGDDGHPIFMHATGEKGFLAAYTTEIEKTAESIKLRNDGKK